jgi:hypothetical protein
MASLQFSDTTSKLGIIQACEDIGNFKDAEISGTTSLLKTFTRHINKAQSEIWMWIFNAYGGWQFEDSNQSGQPNASQTLTSGTSEYAMPTGTHAIRGVEVTDSAGPVRALAPLTEEEIRQRQAVGEFFKTASSPMYYVPMGVKIKLFPAPNYTLASGLTVYFDREMVAFASTATTATPGFPSAFHDAVPVGATLEWLRVHKPGSDVTKAQEIEWQKWQAKITKFFQQRYEQMYPPRFTTGDETRQYI